MKTLQAMKDEGRDILRKLEDNCLLESMEFNDYGIKEDCVRMHGLVSDMALQITRTSSQFMVQAGEALIELPEKGKWTEELQKLEKVSLMMNKIKEIPSGILSSECTMLTTWLLSNNKLSTIPKSVFEHLPALRILDLSYNPQLRSLPSSISELVNLTTLLLEHCASLIKVPSLSKLGALKKLDLDWTNIKEVPKGLEMCTNLKYLSLKMPPTHKYLSVMGSFDKLDDTILLNLSKLLQLFVDERIALRGEVIGRLKKLKAFEGRFLTAHDWSIFLKCFHGQRDGLNKYFLTVGNESLRLLSGKYLKKMAVCGIDIVGENIILPPSVNGLVIGRCDNIRSLNDFSSIKDATDLKGCQIYGCEGMECVFSSWINPLVQTLKELSLSELDRLEGLFEADAIAPPTTATWHLFIS